MIKLTNYCFLSLLVLFGCSCKSEELKEASNLEGIQTAVSFIDAMQNKRFSEVYEYLHPKLKRDWGRRPVALWNFSDYVVESKFVLPDNFISTLMAESQQHEWPKYLFAEILKLAHEQNAFPIDMAAYRSDRGLIESVDFGKSDKIFTIRNGDKKQLRLYLSLEGELWKIFMLEQRGNGSTITWPKGVME